MDQSAADQSDLRIERQIRDITTSHEQSEACEPLHVIEGHRLRAWLLHEPLVHFLLAGIALFAAASLFERSTGISVQDARIVVSASEIERLRDLWTLQRGRPPDAKEMGNLIDEHVREEVLYREAIASGLDKDDTIVRRRLVEKMEFLSQEFASVPPSEQDLENYFQADREKFRVPAQIAFSHLYFSSKRGVTAERDARAALSDLSSRKISSSKFRKLGDPFMLQTEYPLQTEQQITELFGNEFAAKLFQLQAGTWAGPLRSTYGFHLIFIQQKLPSRIPELNEVRDQVLTALKNYRLQAASEEFYAQLRRRYRVEIDKSSLALTDSKPLARRQNKPAENSDSSGQAAADMD